MANPKHRHSKSRRDKRRTQKQKLTAPNLAVCPQCQEVKKPHHACLSCGTYNGREIVTVQQI
ncbi:MAG TPA: 50S ribosomal protein L32 [Nitrospirota bacterium]|jgi:large subunit ribosomal protein L32|nr:50S ribosomal protein L32 [Nitrospirota bacterium]